MESKGVIRREKTAENRTGRVIVLRWRSTTDEPVREDPPALARDELRDQREEKRASVAECVTSTPRPPEEKTDAPDDWRRVVEEFGPDHPVGRMATRALAELGQLTELGQTAEPGHVEADGVQVDMKVTTEIAAAESVPPPVPVVPPRTRPVASSPPGSSKPARSATTTPRPRGVSAPLPGIPLRPRPHLQPRGGRAVTPTGPQTFGAIWGAFGPAPWMQGTSPRPSG